MSRERSHWHDCWRDHHDCAVAHIERMEADAPTPEQRKRWVEMVRAEASDAAGGASWAEERRGWEDTAVVLTAEAAEWAALADYLEGGR